MTISSTRLPALSYIAERYSASVVTSVVICVKAYRLPGTDRSYSSKNLKRSSRICSSCFLFCGLGSRAIRPKGRRIEIVIGKNDVAKSLLIKFVGFFDDSAGKTLARLASIRYPYRTEAAILRAPSNGLNRGKRILSGVE